MTVNSVLNSELKMVVLVFLIDALGFDHLKQEMSNLSYIHQLSKEGRLAKIETLLGYSSGILPAIWSGTSPQKNGVWCEYFMEPRSSNLVSSLLKRIPTKKFKRWGSCTIFKLLQSLHINTNYLYSIPPEIEHLFSKWNIEYDQFPIIRIPQIPMLSDFLDENNIRWHYYFYEHVTKRDIEKIPSTLPLKLGTNEIIIYYITDVDSYAHTSGLKSYNVKNSLRTIDEFIEKIVKNVRDKTKDVELLLFSDHGMAEVRERIDIEHLLDENDLSMPRDYVAFYDSTLARFWFTNERAKTRLEETLEASSAGRILSETDLEFFHLKFGKRKYGDLMFLANEGIEIYPNYYHPMRKNYVKALHGYDPRLSCSNAFILYSGKASFNPNARISVLDICPSILHLLGIESQGDFEGSSIFIK